MNLDKTDDIELDEEPAKKGFDFGRYVQQLQQLDMENMGVWPRSIKLTVLAMILLLIGLLSYFLLIRGVREDLTAAEAQQQNLLDEYRDKTSKLRNLQQYQAQVRNMEDLFNLQLQQLPKQTEIPGLVEDINMAGVRSGLAFNKINLEPEIRQEVFIEQPISISVIGNYHSMGNFVSSIAALPRIVTLHNFDIKTQDVQGSEVPKLVMNMQAKTYRYMTEQERNEASQDKNKEAKK